jgi:hypothetical protein
MYRKGGFMKKIIVLMLFLLLVGLAFAQETEAPKDNTGTNPINFTNDFRIYHNYSQLNTAGDGDRHTTTVEFRTPFADGKWQFRARWRYVKSKVDINNDGIDEIDDNGIGNMDIRFVTVPYLNMEKKFALAVGLEGFFDTANDPAIAESSTSLGPQVFAVFFKPPGGGELIAPAYQHVFSVGGKDVNRSQIDIFYLYRFPDSFINWAMINPQAVIDYENHNSSFNIDLEAGKMLTEHQSVYLRPGFGIGGERAFDWDLEVGWKIIW